MKTSYNLFIVSIQSLFKHLDKDNKKNIDIIFDVGSRDAQESIQLSKKFPTAKIYCFEPNDLHLSIAKRDFGNHENIKFINCGLGNKTINSNTAQEEQNNCAHDYQALNIDTLDNTINEKVDFIKMEFMNYENTRVLIFR